MKYLIVPVVLYFLAASTLISNLAWSEEKQVILRISHIKASKGEEFFVDKKLKTLKSILKSAVKEYQHFIPIKIKDKQEIELGKKHRIKLNKTMFVDIQLDPVVEDYYPISVRWFIKEKKDKETEIVKAKNHKLKVDSSLLIGKKTKENAPTAELIAIEFVDPTEDKS